jgi:UDP-N-acetylmuramate--alanine ligase
MERDMSLSENHTKLPGQLRPMGRVHFVGIGGIGMSGIAEVMHDLGFSVQGSDLGENANVQRLRRLGIEVFVGHSGENIRNADVLAISSAVKDDNPEVVEAHARAIPVVRRAEMLAELMRIKPCITIAGTHGKTTTTSLIAAVLDAGGVEPTVINGGIINSYGTNARLGSGEWMVVEADESDGTFVRLPSTIAVITNIDPEHLEYYGSFDALKQAFKSYLDNIPFYGVGIVCLDHPEVQSLVGRIDNRRLVTYGLNEQADIRAINIRVEGRGQRFDVLYRDRKSNNETQISDIDLPMAGKHNLQNALAAIASGLELNLDADHIKAGLSGFSGVKRRFSLAGQWNGIDIIDDYAHHPVEITAALESARDVSKGRVISIVQPHRYTRLRDLFEDFCKCLNGADYVFVLPVYEAGETPIEGFQSENLVAGLLAHGHRHARLIGAKDPLYELGEALVELGKADDIIICMGAGSVSQLAHDLEAKLNSLMSNGASAADKSESGGAN